ncbi:MAG: hypothetical protein HYT75_02320 [Deltaproteobacteria bacterium]|nr:hypothetical protein [Deltaproteobacteria bacterium]
MKKTVKIVCMFLAIAAIWFSFSFRSGKAFFKLGTWERPIHISAIDDDSGDSDGSDFA